MNITFTGCHGAAGPAPVRRAHPGRQAAGPTGRVARSRPRTPHHGMGGHVGPPLQRPDATESSRYQVPWRSTTHPLKWAANQTAACRTVTQGLLRLRPGPKKTPLAGLKMAAVNQGGEINHEHGHPQPGYTTLWGCVPEIIL